MLRAVMEFRLVTNDQLARITGTQKTTLNKRILLLNQADYLDRPDQGNRLFERDAERPVFNALGQRGAAELVAEGVSFPEKKGWGFANREISSKTWMTHQWGTVESYLIFRDVLSGAGLRQITRDELLDRASVAAKQLSDPWWFATRFVHPGTGITKRRGTRSDAQFAIGDSRTGGVERRMLQFLEFDNDTTPFVRSDPDQSSIAGLYLRYADMYQRQLHTERLGFKNFRVPIVVNAGWDRVHSMLGVFQKNAKHLLPASVFLHTTFEELKRHGPLAPIWLNGKGSSVLLIKE